MNSSLMHLFLARVRVFIREPEAVFWTFGFPILIAVALGIAFRSRGPDKIYVAVESGGAIAADDVVRVAGEDPAATPASLGSTESVRAAIAADPGIDAVIATPDAAHESLRTGKVAVVVVPGDPVTFRFDPTRPESRIARLAVASALDRALGREPAYRSADETVTEKGSRYIDFLVPGLIGMNIMSASMWGIGYSIVDQRGKKLLKRMAATPMPRYHYLSAFLLGHVVLVSATVAVVVLFARLAFGVTVFGSYFSFYVVCLAGAMSFAGLGILMASRTDNSEVLSGMNNAAMLPMFVGSGVFFSYEHFPAVVLPLIKLLPLTALNDALRAIAIDGASITHCAPQLAILAVWGLATFLLALRAFRWT